MLGYCRFFSERNWKIFNDCLFFNRNADILTQTSRSPCIQLFVQKDYLGLYKTALCDTVQCIDGALGKEKISFIKSIEPDSWRSNVF